MQLSLFDDLENPLVSVKKDVTVKNSAKDAVSRYSLLRKKLDRDSTNQNWLEINTAQQVYTNTTLNYIDLFAGGGGISLGFKQAGLNKLLSVELDKDASDTIKRNFPYSVHFEGKVEEITRQVLEEIIAERPIHIICGGPPCQGFSVAGLRDPNDPRNQLFREFIRIAREMQPLFVVLENVPGILTLQNGDVYKEIIHQFSQIGYPNMSVRILEAAEFGVPQLRTRTIFIANRLGLKNPYPAPQLTKEHYVSIDSTIDDLKNLERNPYINHEWTSHSQKFEERLSQVPPGGSLYSTFRDAFKRQHRGVPSMTIKENHGGVHVHYEKNRVLSAREMARLQTFPDEYIFSGTMKRAYWQIGNAVPCLLAKNIGLALKSMIEQYQAAEQSRSNLIDCNIQAFAPLL